ncbi:hypothetical protein [Azospirillum sp.]|uniref:hypothetical protein n=1 Tax=Azospirillum sp. TaxID=34012 RepID=UPI002D25A3C4|nr:hypothetical protein [Azospirillum sp.]HYD67709.1 hypothetical protein [Azospirillum sp.]
MADSQDTRTLPLSRRSLLTSAPAALAAPPLPAAAPDPTLPLYEAWAEALRLTETLANIWAEKPVDAPMDPELIAAYDHCDTLAAQLLATRPTTLAGLVAKLRCIQEHLACREDVTFLDIFWISSFETHTR